MNASPTRRSVAITVGLVIAVTVALGVAGTATAATGTVGAADRTSGRESPLYWSTIRTTIAQAFHRSPRQLASVWGVGTKRGKGSDPIVAYATQHGMSIAALRALELRAMQRAPVEDRAPPGSPESRPSRGG